MLNSGINNKILSFFINIIEKNVQQCSAFVLGNENLGIESIPGQDHHRYHSYIFQY